LLGEMVKNERVLLPGLTTNRKLPDTTIALAENKLSGPANPVLSGGGGFETIHFAHEPFPLVKVLTGLDKVPLLNMFKDRTERSY
jgi:hypothetical protein